MSDDRCSRGLRRAASRGRFTPPGRTITETDLVSFSALTGDWHPQHADAEWAAESRSAAASPTACWCSPTRRPGPVRSRARRGAARPRRVASSARCGSATRSTSRAEVERSASSTPSTGLVVFGWQDRQPGRPDGRHRPASRSSAAPAATPPRQPAVARRPRTRSMASEVLPVILEGKRILDHRRRQPAASPSRSPSAPSAEGAEVRPDQLRSRPADDRARRDAPARAARGARARRQRATRTSPRCAPELAEPLGARSTASSTRSRFAPPDALGGEFLSAPARERRGRVRDQRLLPEGARRGRWRR